MQISRRNALLGATAAAAVTGLTVAPLAFKAFSVKAALAGQTVEPLLAMEQKWLAQRALHANSFDQSDEVVDPLFARLEEIEEQIYLTPARTSRGVAIKLRLWSHYYAPWNHPWTPWWEGVVERMALDEKGVAMMMRDLLRLSGGLPS